MSKPTEKVPTGLERLHHGFAWTGKLGLQVSPRFVAGLVVGPLVAGLAAGAAMGFVDGDPIFWMSAATGLMGSTSALVAGIVALAYAVTPETEIVVDHRQNRLVVGGVPVTSLDDVSVTPQGDRLKLSFREVRYLLSGVPDTLNWMREHVHAPDLDEPAFQALRGADCPEGITPTHHGWSTQIEVRRSGQKGFHSTAISADLATGSIDIGVTEHGLETLSFALRGAREVEVLRDEALVAVLQARSHEAAAWIVQNTRRLVASQAEIPAAIARMRAERTRAKRAQNAQEN